MVMMMLMMMMMMMMIMILTIMIMITVIFILSSRLAFQKKSNVSDQRKSDFFLPNTCLDNILPSMLVITLGKFPRFPAPANIEIEHSSYLSICYWNPLEVLR